MWTRRMLFTILWVIIVGSLFAGENNHQPSARKTPTILKQENDQQAKKPYVVGQINTTTREEAIIKAPEQVVKVVFSQKVAAYFNIVVPQESATNNEEVRPGQMERCAPIEIVWYFKEEKEFVDRKCMTAGNTAVGTLSYKQPNILGQWTIKILYLEEVLSETSFEVVNPSNE